MYMYEKNNLSRNDNKKTWPKQQETNQTYLIRLVKLKSGEAFELPNVHTYADLHMDMVTHTTRHK